jgi:DNA polymerase-4
MKTPQPPLNMALPYTMHIDLNSCFAIIEQQANRLLRGRPVGIAAYDTPRGFVIAASYQAKAKGVKLGVNVGQARAMCPGIAIMTPDPAKYREAHKLFKELLLEYTPDVVPKSIDEFVLNMNASPALRSKILSGLSHNEAMLEIGNSMKQKIRERLGEYVTVNVGISTNRFLAKYAAGFGKPDGMTLIDHANLESMYKDNKLVDLPGINTKYRARLRLAGIYTPLDFLSANLQTLRKQVFKSIVGYYWYQQLRGYEIETKESARKTIGHQYALPDKTTDIDKLERLLIKLCEKTGRRLRKNNLYAQGIHLYLGFASDYPSMDGPSSFENMHNIKSWHHGERVYHRLYSTSDIYEAAKKLLHSAEISGNVKIMSVTVFNLSDWDPEQLSIFDSEGQKSKVENTESKVEGQKSKVKTIATDIRSQGARKRTSDAVDAINNRYGEFVINPAIMMDMNGEILDRIAFGQVKDM